MKIDIGEGGELECDVSRGAARTDEGEGGFYLLLPTVFILKSISSEVNVYADVSPLDFLLIS